LFALPLSTTPELDDVRYIAKIDGRNFFIYSAGRWQKKFLKGVNIGVGKPGAFPGEYAITKAEYLRWFQNISDMNAEVIRVYTIQKPEFYDALHEFNRTAKKPLYLLHGVYMREELIRILEDVHSNHSQIKQEFIADAQELVDVLHGNAKLPEQPGRASGEYKSDVSEYVIGWILGIEWDPMFVIRTNKRNSAQNNYSGKFLYTEKASPFEAFLCEVGDKVLTYEIDKYKMFRPLSYTNWLTTDILKLPMNLSPTKIRSKSMSNISKAVVPLNRAFLLPIMCIRTIRIFSIISTVIASLRTNQAESILIGLICAIYLSIIQCRSWWRNWGFRLLAVWRM
jgi:hypothetical protein